MIELEMTCIQFFLSDQPRYILLVACSAGYFGPNCSLPCRYPNYGVECQFECVCDMENCSHITGCQNSSNA